MDLGIVTEAGMAAGIAELPPCRQAHLAVQPLYCKSREFRTQKPRPTEQLPALTLSRSMLPQV